ncbi:DUF4215 domain-containing protein, partial [Patescibacteria group bacterium]|nr:DUF4215 domain-containing protein [Patescibacteria group bacterium]
MTKGTNWNSLYNGGAVGDDYHINERGQGTYALWYFTNVKSGDYNLDLTWPDVGVDLSDNLEIWVLDYAQGKGLYGNKDWAWILQQHPFSQEFAPSGQPDRSGISWGRVNHGQDGVPVKLNILGGDIVYVLIRPKRQSNYIADAVRLVPVDNFVPPPPPLFEEIIIDNEDSRKIRFRPEDNWYSDIGDYDAGYDGSTHIYDGESSGTAYAVWNLNEVQQGNYTLYATWNRDDIARNVNVLSYIDGEMDFETMDQSRMPSVEFDGNDSLWKRVMEIYIPPKDRNRNISALIYFWNRAENRIIADAIMLVPDGMEPPSSDCEDYDDNEADCFEAGCYFDYLDGICSEERLECTDELDQDDDPKIKGNIWGYVEYILDGKGRAKSEDTCDGLELQQVYCSDDEFLGINTLLCANACDEGVCVDYGEPYCADVDTRSENWRVNNNGEIERIKDDNCKGCKALCLNEGTRSEGWYSSCGEELIKYDNCSGEEEVYNIHVRGVLRDQMTSAPIGRAELTSPYEFEVYSTSPMIVETFTSGGMQIKKYYTNEQGVFDFLVRSDFRTNLENPEDNTSDESGWWNFKRGCYHWSGFGLRKGDDGDLELSKTIFDQSETWQSTDGRNFVNVHALPAYPFADIHLQSDQPVSFDVNYHYKNLSGTNGPGVGNFSTDRGLMTALPLDYDVHLTLMDENGQEYQSPVYRTPREAMCKQLEFGFFDGEGEWSFCGNGEVEGTEDCDDGNDNDEDGCSNNCDSGDSDCEGIEDKEVCRLGISSGLCYWDDEKRECSSDRKLCFDQDGYLDDYGAHNALSITYGYELGDQDQVDVSRDGHEDYCGTAGSEAGKLKEYYCRDEYHVGFELVDCPYGCEYGACLRDLSKCGDGILNHPYEYCDDGNTDPRDGCDQYCKIEIGWTCEVGPSICPAQCTSNDECSGDQVCVNGTCTEQQLCSDPDAAPGRVFVTGSWQCRPGEEEGGNFKLKMRGEKVRELFGFEERQYDISKDHGISDSDGIDCGRSLRGLHIHPTEDSSINLIANPNSQTDGICHRNPQIRIRGEYQSTEFEVQDLENCYLENSYELYDTDNCWTEDGVQQCEKERVYSGEFVCYDAELGFGDTECETDSDCPNEQVCLDGECVSNATLTIAVKNIGYEDTAVENQKNINLLRFEASASAAEDLLLTKIILDVDSGSLLNGQNYALWVDTDYNYNEDTISNVDTIL